MPRFERAELFVKELASEILCQFEDYKPLLDAKVTIDYLFAYGDKDDNGDITTPAITVNGVPALGCCRIVNHRDRVKGCADVEIQLDADHYLSIDRDEQKALLDHELFHIELDPKGRKDHGDRPKLHLRHHDAQFGWFRAIAARHGKASQERIQAASLLEDQGQWFWPEIVGPVASAVKAAAVMKEGKRLVNELKAGGVTITVRDAQEISKAIAANVRDLN